jgi:hypothetical protein
VPPGAEVLPQQTIKAIQEINAGGSVLGDLLDNKLAGSILKKLVPDEGLGLASPISIEETRTLRTYIGHRISDPNVQVGTDLPQAQLKQIYGALTRDLETAAKAISPESYRKFMRANKFYKAGADRLEKVIGAMGDPSSKMNAERIFLIAKNATKVSGGDARKLGALRRSMDDDTWDMVGGLVLRQMGASTKDLTGFSPAAFAETYGKMSEAAKDILFKGGPKSILRQGLDDLFLLSHGAKRADRLANKSQSARYQILAAPFGAGWFLNSPGTAAGALVGSAITSLLGGAASAALLTNPKFVNWLSTANKIHSGNKMSAHMARLSSIVRTTPELSDPIQKYIETVTHMTAPQKPQSLAPEA